MWLLDSTRALRDEDGAYWTGLALRENVHFPADERSVYTAAAVILANDALAEESPRGTSSSATRISRSTR